MMLLASAIGCALLTAAACGGDVDASFSPSTVSGPVPLTVDFTPITSQEGLTFAWDFGDSQTSADLKPSHTFRDAGDFTVTLTVSKGGRGGVSSRMQIRAEPGVAGWAAVKPGAAELKAGEQAQFMAEAFDELGNGIPGAQFTWTSDPDAGEITPGGLFTAALGIGTYSSGITATFDRLGKTGVGTASLTLKPGKLVAIRVDPQRINVQAGGRMNLSAVAVDTNGLPVKGGTFKFEALRSADRVDSGSQDTALLRAGTKATEADTDLVRVSAELEGQKLEMTVRGRVSAGVLDTLILGPPELVLNIKDVARLSALGQDRFGNTFTLDDVKWTLLNSEPGVVDEQGRFTAGTKAGDYTDNWLIAQGTKSKVSTSAAMKLTILPGAPVSLSIDPKSDSVPTGAASPLLATLKDAYGNVIPEEDAPLVWEALAGGRVTEFGYFVAGLKTGVFTDAVRVSLPPRTMGNPSALIATASVTVRQRSSDTLALEVSDGDGLGIILIDLASAETRPLAASLLGNGAREFAPCWISDGSRLIFAGEADGKFQIFDADIKTGKVRRLTDDPQGAIMPAVSPDGRGLVYASVEPDGWGIYVIDISAFSGSVGAPPVPRTSAKRIVKTTDLSQILMKWSPDGARIGYTIASADEVLSVAVVNADGSGQRALGDGKTSEVFLDWSKDGSQVLASRDRGDGGGTLTIIDVATGARKTLIEVPFAVLLAQWAPDGSELAVIDAEIGAMWFLDSDGTGLRQAFGADSQPRGPAWRPVAINTSA